MEIMDRNPGADKRTAIMFYDIEDYPGLLNMDITSKGMIDIIKRGIDSDVSIEVWNIPGEDSRTVARHIGKMLGDVRSLTGPTNGYYIESGNEFLREFSDGDAPDDKLSYPFTHYTFRKSYQSELVGIIEKYVKIQERFEYSRNKRISRAIEGPEESGFLMFRD